MASAVGAGSRAAGSPRAESGAQQKKATSKHKAMERQLVEDPSREAISLDKLLDHERLDLKWLKRDLAVNTLPETMAVLREIENRSETPLLREDGRPRRRKSLAAALAKSRKTLVDYDREAGEQVRRLVAARKAAANLARETMLANRARGEQDGTARTPPPHIARVARPTLQASRTTAFISAMGFP